MLETDPTRARDDAVALLLCPACTGMLVPDLDRRDDPFAPLCCLDCAEAYPFVKGVLDLTPRLRPTRPRRYPLGGKDLDFWGFFESTLQTRAYADTDPEDQIYHLLSWLDYRPGERLLVLGCGRGELSRLVADACPDSPVLSFDDALDELIVARAAQARAGLSGLFVRCDLRRLPVRPGAFAAAFHFGLLHSLGDPVGAMQRIGALLAPGGRLVGVTLARSSLENVAATQAAMAKGSGLDFVPMEDLAKAMMRSGWARLRHEQPSNWMARFVAVHQ